MNNFYLYNSIFSKYYNSKKFEGLCKNINLIKIEFSIYDNQINLAQ